MTRSNDGPRDELERRILRVLKDAEEPMTALEVGAAAMVRPMHLLPILDRLVAKRRITASKLDVDPRATLYERRA